MSVVIIGGNERMETRYADICKAYGYDKAKVFVKENSSLKKKVGTPDLLILFTNTVSHKMMLSATAFRWQEYTQAVWLLYHSF